MIPILYYGNEASFTSEGIGRLTDIQECKVTEERNGVYEVEFTYPVKARYYKLLVQMVQAYAIGNLRSSGIIACIHDDDHDVQPFDIYSVSTPIDGIATFNAHHISYRLSGLIVNPFTASDCPGAFRGIQSNLVGESGGGTNYDDVQFTFSTNKATIADFKLTVPKDARSILGGEEGSILDVFGAGEYLFDKFNVRLLNKRGRNSGLKITYGVNLMDISRDIDSSGTFNCVCPYWEGDVYDEGSSESRHVLVTRSHIRARETYSTGSKEVIVPIDFSQEFEDPPTTEQLAEIAQLYLTLNKPWIPDENIKVDFLQLWQTTDYENDPLIQKLSLCDTVSVYYEDIGIVADEQEVIKVVYDVILERYSSFEIGKPLRRLIDDFRN